jgi:hypothetical protein
MYFKMSRSSGYRFTTYLGGPKLNLSQETFYEIKTFRGFTTRECCVTLNVVSDHHVPAHLSHFVIRNYYNMQRYRTCSV